MAEGQCSSHQAEVKMEKMSCLRKTEEQGLRLRGSLSTLEKREVSSRGERDLLTEGQIYQVLSSHKTHPMLDSIKNPMGRVLQLSQTNSMFPPRRAVLRSKKF
jgi:hypothetical protein